MWLSAVLPLKGESELISIRLYNAVQSLEHINTKHQHPTHTHFMMMNFKGNAQTYIHISCAWIYMHMAPPCIVIVITTEVTRSLLNWTVKCKMGGKMRGKRRFTRNQSVLHFKAIIIANRTSCLICSKLHTGVYGCGASTCEREHLPKDW